MASIKKLNILSYNPDIHLRDSNLELNKWRKNVDPDLHPLKVAREYKLALNATKLERNMAKPFVASLTHNDSITSIAKHPELLNSIFSATYLGELYLWDARARRTSWKVQAHNGPIWSVSSDSKGKSLFSVGHDKAIKQWSHELISNACDNSDVYKGAGSASHINEPVETWLCETVVTKLSHHANQPQFLSCGARVLLWDCTKKVPIRSFDWNGPNSAIAGCTARDIAFNQTQTNLFASSDENNNLVLYDVRAKEVKKLMMKHRINSICWNPMEPFIFTAASEDYNAYTFDIRYMDDMDRILATHSGHTAALTHIDYAPTGREFVTSSCDKSIRIFPVDEYKSRDIYHSKRMHKVSCCLWSADNKFIYSGSTDHNIRIWKARASEKLGLMSKREQLALDYSNQLKDKFRHMPEIRRIAKHRHVPKSIQAAAKEHHRIRTGQARKEANVKDHTKPGVKVGETAVEKPVFGLKDETEVDEETQREEIKKLTNFAKSVYKKQVQAEGKVTKNSKQKSKKKKTEK